MVDLFHLASPKQIEEARKQSDALRIMRSFSSDERRAMARAGALPGSVICHCDCHDPALPPPEADHDCCPHGRAFAKRVAVDDD